MRGFTMLELLVSVAILALITPAIYNVLIFGQRTFYSGTDTLQMQSRMRIATSYITRELRQAADYTIGINNDSIVFSTPNEASIHYFRDTGDANGDGLTSQMIREYPAGTLKVIANDISLLQFSPSGSLVQIRIDATKSSGGRQIQLSSTVKAEARNEE